MHVISLFFQEKAGKVRKFSATLRAYPIMLMRKKSYISSLNLCVDWPKAIGINHRNAYDF